MDARPGIAQSLLAAAVVALEPLTRDGSPLAGIRSRLDAGPRGAVTSPRTSRLPPLGSCIRNPGACRPPRTSSCCSEASVVDPGIPEDALVLFAPLIGLELDTLPDELIDVGFPLSWIWPAQLGAIEDPDISRDWIAQGEGRRPIACLALATSPERGPLLRSDYAPELEPLRRRRTSR